MTNKLALDVGFKERLGVAAVGAIGTVTAVGASTVDVYVVNTNEVTARVVQGLALGVGDEVVVLYVEQGRAAVVVGKLS